LKAATIKKGMLEAWREYAKAAQQFGLTPAAKARVAAEAEEVEDDGKQRFFPRAAS
jgi:phage terminase small subunit